MLTTINTTRYSRFFAFGCSFTHYSYATWADIIGNEIPEYYNYGLSGAGNPFIFHSFIEANVRHKFNSDDLIIIMLTNVSREDHWVNGSWLQAGNIYTQRVYDEKFVEQFADDNGYLIRDLSFITALKTILDNIGCDYDFLSMVPITTANQYQLDTIYKDKEKYLETVELYKDTISSIKPSVQELLYPNCDWNRYERLKTREADKSSWYYDQHPATNTYLKYLQLIFDTYIPSDSTKYMIEDQMNKIRNIPYTGGDPFFISRTPIKRL